MKRQPDPKDKVVQAVAGPRRVNDPGQRGGKLQAGGICHACDGHLAQNAADRVIHGIGDLIQIVLCGDQWRGEQQGVVETG